MTRENGMQDGSESNAPVGPGGKDKMSEKKKRLPWGHESRHCVVCGKVGPRIFGERGYIHKYCMGREELKRHNKKMRSTA